MNRRQMMHGAALTALAGYQGGSASAAPVMHAPAFLELKTWRLHNSGEGQAKRVGEYLEHGLFPAMVRAGAKPVAAFGNLIGPDGPYLMTAIQFASLGAMQDAMRADADAEHEKALEQMSTGGGVPFVRVESSLLACFKGFPEAVMPAAGKHGRVFELRTYESQSPAALKLKIGMFEGGEIGIFERLGMQPVFFGSAIVGPKQPCVTYMLSFDSLAEREKLWAAFGSDPEWKRISAPAALKDSEIVGNIGNVMLKALAFSPLQ